MSVAINCNFARVAIRELSKKNASPRQKLSGEIVRVMLHEFSQQFEGNEKFTISLLLAKKRFPDIDKIFNRPWVDKAAKLTYEAAFSL